MSHVGVSVHAQATTECIPRECDDEPERERWSRCSTHTAWPLRNSCLVVTTGLVVSCQPVRLWTLIVSLSVVTTLSGRTPLARGESLMAAVRSSPAAQALCGTMIEYMTFSGHVFSISSDCWYSTASGTNDRSNVITLCVCRLWAKPGRVAVARSLYVTEVPPYAFA